MTLKQQNPWKLLSIGLLGIIAIGLLTPVDAKPPSGEVQTDQFALIFSTLDSLQSQIDGAVGDFQEQIDTLNDNLAAHVSADGDLDATNELELPCSGCVGSAEIDDHSIKGNDIENAAVGSLQIEPGAVGTSQIENHSIKGIDIENAAVGSLQIEPGAVGSSQIENNSIRGVDIEDGAITADDMAGVSKLIFAKCTDTTQVVLNGGQAQFICAVPGAAAGDNVVATLNQGNGLLAIEATALTDEVLIQLGNSIGQNLNTGDITISIIVFN